MTGIERSLLFLLLVTGSAAASAQRDRASRDDTADYLRKLHARKQSPAVGLAAPPAGWSETLSLTGVYTTNGGQTPQNRVRTFYGTPSATLAYATPENSTALHGWQFNGSVMADADFFAKQPGSLNESRLSGEAMFTRKLQFGDIAFGAREQSTWGSAYSGYTYSRGGAILSITPHFGDPIGLSLQTEYRISDSEEERRWLLLANGQRSLFSAQTRPGHKLDISLNEEVRASFFRSGASSGRHDLRSTTTISFDPGLLPETSAV